MNTMDKKLTATDFERQFYEEHRAAGLDYMGYGGWQERYGRWFVDSFEAKGKRVLDLGCACGSIMRGLAVAGALVEGVDISRHMTQLAIEADPTMARIMWCADAKSMPMFESKRFDAVHCAFVAEHWQPERVWEDLKEINRVMKVGGLLFVSLDTEEMYAEQGRKLEDEDPTHTCVKTKSWWTERFYRTGFTDGDVGPIVDRMRAHPESMLSDYPWWPFFVLRRFR